jgi:enoyl-CoA hydratase
MNNPDCVIVEVTGGVAQVTMNRPEQRNAIDPELGRALRAAFDRIEADPAIRVTVLCGAGPVFCAGMDLKSFRAGHAEAILFGPHGFAGFVARARRKPVIAAVTGAALAGGFEIMLACDMVVAGESARFGLPEAKLGLVAGAGGAMRLARRVPRVLANELLLTAKTFSAAEMRDWGLLNRVVPDAEVLATAQELARAVAANAPLSIEASLSLSDHAFAEEEARIWPENDAALRRLSESADVGEGISAFFEKRPPEWNGR